MAETHSCAPAAPLAGDGASLAPLIERLEQATEGSDALDVAVECLLTGAHRSPYGVNGVQNDLGELWAAPRYTRSIDAALTLVPSVTPWAISLTNGGYMGSVFAWADSTWIDVPTAHSAAIALCIAALKARASEAPTPDQGTAGAQKPGAE